MARQNKSHHKVPQTYLQAFTFDGKRVWVCDDKFRLFSEKPKNILAEDDYYTVRFPDGGGTLQIETKFLGGTEAKYAEIYREKISQRKPLTSLEKAEMAVFVASMLERSPRRRDALQDFFDRVGHITEKMRTMVAGMTPEEKKAFTAAQQPASEDSIPADEFLKAGEDVGSLHSANIPQIVKDTAPIIFGMKWAFMVRPQSSQPFITSDSPCALENPSLPARSIYGPGLQQKDVELSLPLSPDLALLCGWRMDRDWDYLPVDPENVDEINRRTRRRSRTLVSNDKSMLERQIARVKAVLKDQEESSVSSM